eukprot:TRINITY_DN84552_c0_g1_i1.p2 TRINITY_DN84552_c0_g1~~TRINITY_DN84552_c0_g1_i1.p2  ORF type:complete len:354 (+),score=42.56 TRINITY_DN84552_c0_g1_i1:59-1120(+)
MSQPTTPPRKTGAPITIEPDAVAALQQEEIKPGGSPNAAYIRDIGVIGKTSRKRGVDYPALHQEVQEADKKDAKIEFTTHSPLEEIRARFLFDGRVDVGEYINDWRLLLTAHEVQLAVQWTAFQINNKFRDESIVLTGILKGVFMFLADLVKLLTIPYNVYFLEASSYKDKQTQSDTVEFMSEIVPEKFTGRKIVLLDELFDNGKTLNSVKDALLDKLQIPEDNIYTCTLFKKNKKTSQKPPDLVAFDVLPDIWLVGYGLDHAGTKRGWPHVFGVPKLSHIPKNEADGMFELEETHVENTIFTEVRKIFHTRLGELAADMLMDNSSPSVMSPPLVWRRQSKCNEEGIPNPEEG